MLVTNWVIFLREIFAAWLDMAEINDSRKWQLSFHLSLSVLAVSVSVFLQTAVSQDDMDDMITPHYEESNYRKSYSSSPQGKSSHDISSMAPGL